MTHLYKEESRDSSVSVVFRPGLFFWGDAGVRVPLNIL